jgi:uncharacterized membrane protein (UPF0127 family)
MSMQIHTPAGSLRIRRADTFALRLLGLMFKSRLPDHEGLLIEPCASVHTCWMRFSIDVLFIDKEGRVCAIKEAVKPFRFAFKVGAHAVLELNAGDAARHGLTVGSLLPTI